MGTRSLDNISLTLALSALIKNDLGNSRVPQYSLEFTQQPTFATGTAASQADRVWIHSATISSAASSVIDLYDFAGVDAGAGAGNDPLGQTLTLAEITAILITNTLASGVAGSLEIEPDATNGWAPIGTHTVSNGGALKAGGTLFKFQPEDAAFVVTDASSHRLKLTANGGNVDYTILILGRSA